MPLSPLLPRGPTRFRRTARIWTNMKHGGYMQDRRKGDMRESAEAGRPRRHHSFSHLPRPLSSPASDVAAAIADAQHDSTTRSANFADPTKSTAVQQGFDKGSVPRLTDDRSNGATKGKTASGSNGAVSSAVEGEQKALQKTDDDEALCVGGNGDTEDKEARVVDEAPKRRIVRRWPSSADLGMISNGL